MNATRTVGGSGSGGGGGGRGGSGGGGGGAVVGQKVAELRKSCDLCCSRKR